MEKKRSDRMVKSKHGTNLECTADLSELFIAKNIDSGAQGKIYQGTYKGRDVAVKIMGSFPTQKEELEPQQFTELERRSLIIQQQFRSELVVSRLHHPNILQYVASREICPVYLILTEYMPKGNLRTFLDKQKRYSLSTNMIIRLALGISRGMEYLHSQGIVHRDLKSSNLLLTDDMDIKVADFGTSCLETQCKGAKRSFGTYRWMAPELIKGKGHSRKVDVYSFGMVLWELATTQLPFQELSPLQAAFAVSDKNRRPAIPESCHPGIADLIKRCWAANPSKRPEFSEIVRALEKYYNCQKNGLPPPLRSEMKTSRSTILERFASRVCLITA